MNHEKKEGEKKRRLQKERGRSTRHSGFEKGAVENEMLLSGGERGVRNEKEEHQLESRIYRFVEGEEGNSGEKTSL